MNGGGGIKRYGTVYSGEWLIAFSVVIFIK